MQRVCSHESVQAIVRKGDVQAVQQVNRIAVAHGPQHAGHLMPVAVHPAAFDAESSVKIAAAISRDRFLVFNAGWFASPHHTLGVAQ